MKYDFKVNLTEDLYKIFLENKSDFNLDKFNSIKEEFEEFRILYDYSSDMLYNDILEMYNRSCEHSFYYLIHVS